MFISSAFSWILDLPSPQLRRVANRPSTLPSVPQFLVGAPLPGPLGCIDDQPDGNCIELLREGTDEYVPETGGAETPLDHFVERLAEWGRGARRQQRGLLPLTAHRTRGLEFDQAVALDGGRNRVGRAADAGAPRRLYYVAMTRARQTLTPDRLPGTNPFLDALRDVPVVLQRDAPIDVPATSLETSRRYRRLSLRNLFLGFAGYRDSRVPSSIRGGTSVILVDDV